MWQGSRLNCIRGSEGARRLRRALHTQTPFRRCAAPFAAPPPPAAPPPNERKWSSSSERLHAHLGEEGSGSMCPTCGGARGRTCLVIRSGREHSACPLSWGRKGRGRTCLVIRAGREGVDVPSWARSKRLVYMPFRG